MLSQGVDNKEREEALTLAVRQDEYSAFLTDLVVQSDNVELFDLLTSTAMNEKKWTLAEAFLTAKFKDADRQQECVKAITSHQWGSAFGLLITGVSVNASNLDPIFKQNMGLILAELLCKSAGNSELAIQLMDRGVAHGNKQSVIHLMEHHSLSDNQVRQVLKAAAELEDRTILCDVLEASSKSRRVFRDNCPYLLKNCWEETPGDPNVYFDPVAVEKLSGLLLDLCKQNQIRLAVSAALSLHEHYFLACLNPQILSVLTDSQTCLSIRDKAMKRYFRRLHENSKSSLGADPSISTNCHTAVINYGNALLAKTQNKGARKAKSLDEVQLFILELLRLRDYATVIWFVRDQDRKYLKFAAQWFIASLDIDNIKNLKKGIVEVSNRHWLIHFVARCSLNDYYKSRQELSNTKGESQLKMFKVFWEMCLIQAQEPVHTLKLFKFAVTETIKHGETSFYAKLVVQFIKHRWEYDKNIKENIIRIAFLPVITKNAESVEILTLACKELLDMYAPWSNTSKCDFLLFVELWIVKMRAWHCLDLLKSLLITHCSHTWNCTKVKVFLANLNQIIYKKAPRSKLAGFLCDLIGNMVMERNMAELLQGEFPREQQHPIVSSLAEWCVKKGHANLALLLGFILDDNNLVVQAFLQNGQTADLIFHHQKMIKAALFMQAFHSAASLFKYCELSSQKLRNLGEGLHMEKESWKEFARICDEVGALDWAIGLVNVHMMKEENWITKEQLQRCKSQVVLDFLLQRACTWEIWHLIQDLSHFFSEKSCLYPALKLAMENAHMETIEVLVDEVGISTLMDKDKGMRDHLWLMRNESKFLQFLRIMVKEGFSSYERAVSDHPIFGDIPAVAIFKHWRSKSQSILSLLLKSGSVSYDNLHEIVRLFKDRVRFNELNERQMIGFRMIRKVARKPERLEHLARLAVSHQIGLQPGRKARVSALPIPLPLKDLINFQDVLTEDDLEPESEELDYSDYIWSEDDDSCCLTKSSEGYNDSDTDGADADDYNDLEMMGIMMLMN